MKIIVQFTDSTEATVGSYLASPQDPDTFPGQTEIDTNDARWKAYYESLPALMRDGLPAPSDG